MATVDKLIVRIEADMKDLKSKLKSAETATKASTSKMKASFAQLKTSVGGVGRSIFSLKGALIGLGVGAGIKSLINVGSSVESLQIRFETIFGSVAEGSKAFEVMADFAGKVPFSLQQIQAGSGSLLAVAGDANELGELLEMTGTIAAATGLDFKSASEQIQRSLSAGIGAADLFRDRGVTAMLGFKAGTQVSVEETRVALEKFAKDNEGITDKLANTFEGTMSMLGDSVFTFQRTVNDAGFFSELTNHFQSLKQEIDNNQQAIADFAMDLSGVLVSAMNGLVTAIKFVANNIELLIFAFKAFIAIKVGIVISNISIALGGLVVALRTATAAQLKLNLAMKANLIGAAVTLLILFADKLIGAGRAILEFTGLIGKKEVAIEQDTEAMKEQEAQLTKVQEAHERYTKYFANEYTSALQAKHQADKRNVDTLEEVKKKLQAEIDLLGLEGRELEIATARKKHNTEAEEKNIEGLIELINKKHDYIDILDELDEAEKNADALSDKLQKSQEKATEKIQDLINENALLKAEYDGLNETELLQLAIRQQLTGATDDQIKKLDELIKKNLELKDQISTKEENEQTAKKKKEDDEETATKKKEEDDQAVLDLVNDLGLLDNAQQDYQDSVDMLDVALADNLIILEQYREGLSKLKMTLLESTEEGKIAIEGLERVQDLLFDNLADALTGAEEGWKGFRDSLKNIVRDIIAQLLKLQAQQAITKMMGQGGGGGGGFDLGKLISIGSSFFGGGGGGGFNPNSSGGQGNIFGFANGGSVNPNTPSLVGEKGPELFVPHTSGGIFTNRSLKNSGGGGATVNQTINIETGVSQTVRAEMASLLPQIKQESVNAVMDAKKRGGQMADTFS